MNKFLFVSILLFSLHQPAKSQGCSDAGFCTIGTLQSQQLSDSLFKHNFKFSMSYGQGEENTIIFQTQPEFEFLFFKNNYLQIKIPYSFINGNLGHVNGFGDVSISITHSLVKTENIKFNITAATKIATGRSDTKVNGLPLPMPYQTSLGTYDIILGTSVHYITWNFGLGFQRVLLNKNRNQFLHSVWPNTTEVQKYFESNFLERGNDVLFRLEKSVKVKTFILTPGLLAIYRLQESTLVDMEGKRSTIENSDGITVNITGNAQYNLSKRTGIITSLGFPVIVRKVRPDGLTRHFVLAAAINYRFGN